MDRPVVFLDIDGVLIRPEIGQPADPVCVDCLNDLLSRSGAAIVVSSSWRVVGLEKMQDILLGWGVAGDVIDVTGDKAKRLDSGIWEVTSRAQEIAEWRRASGHTGTFVILDDERDMADLEEYHVWTDFHTGLTAENVRTALEILGGN